MELTKLEYFVAACRFQNMSKAADALLVSQQSISKAIASLESELGTTLFVRERNQLRLTNDGQYLLQKANWILTEADVVTRHFQEKQDKGQPILIGATDALLSKCSKPMHDLMFGEGRDRPFNVQFIESKNWKVEQDVLRGIIRFGMIFTPSFNSDFDYTELGRFSQCFVINPKHPLAGKKDVSLYQIAQYPLVIPSDEHVPGRMLDELFRQKGLRPFRVLSSVNAIEIFEMIKKNENFIGRVVTHDIDLIKPENITVLDLNPPLEDLGIFLVTRKHVSLSRTEKKFRDVLISTFALD